MKKTILTTALFLTIGQIGFAQTYFNKSKLDNYFSVLEENNKFMGSVAVSKNGEIIYTKTIGFADVENKVKQVLQQKLSQLDFVSREEVDVQTQVLAKTRAKLDELERRVAELSVKDDSGN